MTLLDHALAYAERGWPVFPVQPAGKAPVGHLVPRGHHDATTDPATLRAWWAAVPGAGIGISLEPAGLVVLDVDVHHDAPGMASLTALAAEIHLPPTLTARTGSGGLHALYARPGGAPATRRIRFRPGLDLLAAGYIVAAPSLHATGATYAWFDPAVPVAPLPPELVPVLTSSARADRQSSASSAPSPDQPDRPPAPPELLADARARLERHGPSRKGQGGDKHAFGVGAILLNDYALTWEEAWPLAVWWNDRFPENHWSHDRLAEKLRNGGRYPGSPRGCERDNFEAWSWVGRAPDVPAAAPAAPPLPEPEGGGPPSLASLAAGCEPLDLTPIMFGGGGPPPDPSTWPGLYALALREVRAALAASKDESGAAAAPPPLFEPAGELLARPHPKTVWLVRGLVKEGGTLVCAGEPKTCKSWALTEIALAVAAGGLAFGEYEVPGARAVAYFYAEDLAPDVATHLRALAAGRGVTPEAAGARLYVQPRGRFLDVLRDEDVALVVASCRRLPEPVGLVVLEPLRDIHSGEEDKSDSMRDVMRRLRLVGDLLQCTVAVAHHAGKAGADTQKRRKGQRMRGSGAIHGSVDSGLYFSDLRGDGKSTFTNAAESEIKGARGGGCFDVTLTIEDDPVTETAIKASWRVDRGGAGPAAPVIEGGSHGMAERVLSAVGSAVVLSGQRALNRDQIRAATKGGQKEARDGLADAEARGWVARVMTPGGAEKGWTLTGAGRKVFEELHAVDRGNNDAPGGVQE